MSENGMTQETITRLIQAALQVRLNSYAPYSHFQVGAALLAEDGTIYTGVNVENASYPAGICAEKTALSKAVSEGQRHFTAIAIVGGHEQENAACLQNDCLPCGVCRQFLSELCPPDMVVITAKSTTDYRIYTLNDLLPFSFSAECWGFAPNPSRDAGLACRLGRCCC
ncbi:MAG: cytidine deaminase [Acutalibacteraceae bacterium]|nr:cytidine deaminase [Acutalibacteraceae bacterium]